MKGTAFILMNVILLAPCAIFLFSAMAYAQSLPAYFAFTKTLQRGSSGTDVTKLQEFLKTTPGIYPEGLITGYFGSLTEKAVKRFQEKNGIEQAGIVGPKTRAALNRFINNNEVMVPPLSEWKTAKGRDLRSNVNYSFRYPPSWNSNVTSPQDVEGPIGAFHPVADLSVGVAGEISKDRYDSWENQIRQIPKPEFYDPPSSFNYESKIIGGKRVLYSYFVSARGYVSHRVYFPTPDGKFIMNAHVDFQPGDKIKIQTLFENFIEGITVGDDTLAPR